MVWLYTEYQFLWGLIPLKFLKIKLSLDDTKRYA